MVRVTEDYSAMSHNELTISKGEVVQLLGYSGSMSLISLQISKNSTDSSDIVKTEGLVPCHILVQKDNNSTRLVSRCQSVMTCFRLKHTVFGRA